MGTSALALLFHLERTAIIRPMANRGSTQSTSSDEKGIYLDHASTTPVDPRVLAAMLPYFSKLYGNPSSMHQPGRVNHAAVTEARETIARCINAQPNEILFTSGGTEADNFAIIGIAHAYRDKGNHIIVSNIEHKAVLDSCKRLEREGFDVTYLPVDRQGIISIEELTLAIRPDTTLVSIMYANNEIGSIQPIQAVSRVLRTSTVANPMFHCDASQATGSLPIDVREIGVDAMTISSSKIYGPKGIGCLFIRSTVDIQPLIVGGGQERGLRSGTENVASIVGFATALEISEQMRQTENPRLTELRDYFLKRLTSEVDDVSVNGSTEHRLPNNVNVSIQGVEGESLLLLLDHYGVYCSTGSACSSADLNPSHVLVNIGIPLELAHCSIRFTLGRRTTKNDVDSAMDVIVKSVQRIRSFTSTNYDKR